MTGDGSASSRMSLQLFAIVGSMTICPTPGYAVSATISLPMISDTANEFEAQSHHCPVDLLDPYCHGNEDRTRRRGHMSRTATIVNPNNNTLPLHCLSSGYPSPPISPLGPRLQQPTLSSPSSTSLTYSSISSNSNGSFFSGARDFIVTNSNLVSIMNSSDTHDRSMEQLARSGFTGAEFDSSERDPPPRCHPGTRSSIISRLHEWREDPERKQSLVWLRGSAGVGKSAIMQTFAEDLSSSVSLGVALFLSKPNRRSDPARVFPSLAYQLAIRNTAYKNYVSGLISQDPSILRKSMAQQFSRLISEPFSSAEFSYDHQTRLILIDGLDECDSERAQREMILLVTSFIQKYPKSPLLWVISSRPEYHLRNTFLRPGVSLLCMILDVPSDGSEACKDVEKFLNKEFEDIRNNHPDIVPVNWPSQRQFLTIAKAASGLFVFASTVIRFITGDSAYGNPVIQLEVVLSSLDLRRQRNHYDSPLSSLDALYSRILAGIPESSIPTLHLILGFYTLKGNTSSLSLLLAANILEVPQPRVYYTLQHLYSVLDIPRPHEAHKKPLRFFHKSFSDYLVDSTRAGPLFLDMEKLRVTFALRYLRKLELILEADNSHTAIPIFWHSPVEDHLGTQILGEVKQRWFLVLPKIAIQQIHPMNSSDLQELICTLGRLKFSAFDVNDALGFINLVNWIATPPSFQWQQLIAEDLPWNSFNLDQIDTTRPSVYYRTRPDRWGYWSANSDSLDVARIPSIKTHHRKYFEQHALSFDEFFKDLNVLGKTPWSLNARVLIIGLNPSRRCAVILTSIEQQETQPVVRYYFPLKE